MTPQGSGEHEDIRLSHRSPTMDAMSDYDITDGGRRRIVSEDQAKNLREQEDLRRMLEGLPVVCTADWSDALSRIEDEGALWDRIGEENQEQGWA